METIEIKNFTDLQHGANSHQYAAISPIENGVDYEILSHEKELSYCDYINLSENIWLLSEFFDVACAVAVKEGVICGVALGSDSENALYKILEADSMGVFESTIGFSKEVTLEVAKQLKSIRVKNILAVGFSKEAFSYLLDTGINMILIKTPLHEVQGFYNNDIKVTPFGILVQQQDNSKLSKENFKVVSVAKPTQEQIEDAVFAWKVSKHLKSCSAAVVKDLCIKAVVQGKPDTITACERAMDLSCENSKDSVLAVDEAISNTEVLNAAIQGRVGLIIEAGDSPNSANILKYADKYGISVIFTKIRNKRY